MLAFSVLSRKERALIFNSGDYQQLPLKTLNNGTKVYTTPENEKLLGGTLSGYEAKQTFAVVVSKANILVNLPKNQALACCKQIRDNLQTLISYTDESMVKLGEKETHTHRELIYAEEQYTQIYQRLQISKSSCRSLEDKLAGLESRRHDLDKEISSLEVDMRTLKIRMEEEETKRVDAAVDWIPLVGFFGGLVTGRYERMLPGYSTVSGIISRITQEKEECQGRYDNKHSERNSLNSELSSVRSSIQSQKDVIRRIETEIRNLDSSKSAKDREIKKLGKDLTAVKNTSLSLKGIFQKYKYLTADVDDMKDLIDMDEMQLLAEEAPNFLIEITEIQKTFLATAI